MGAGKKIQGVIIYTSKANIKRNEDEFQLEYILIKVTDNVEVIHEISRAAEQIAEEESLNNQGAENKEMAPEEFKPMKNYETVNVKN